MFYSYLIVLVLFKSDSFQVDQIFKEKNKNILKMKFISVGFQFCKMLVQLFCIYIVKKIKPISQHKKIQRLDP